jgi:aarF domain-containing kinase
VHVLQALLCAIVHWGLGRWPQLVQDLDDLGMLKASTDKQQLARDLQQQFAAVQQQQQQQLQPLAAGTPPACSLSMGLGDLSNVLARLALRYRSELPTYYTLILRCLATLEGVALRADPQFKLLPALLPLVLQKLLTDSR